MVKRSKMTKEERENFHTTNFNYLKELESKFYREDECYNLDYELCIITCHNRKPSFLDNISQFSSQVNVFIYDFEKELYDWLEEGPTLKKVIVPDEYLSVAKMRKFVQQYMGRKKYWVADDDCKNFAFANDKHKLSMGLGLKMTEEVIHNKVKDDYIIIGFSCAEPCTKWWGGEFARAGSPYCLILFDGAKAIDNNVYYSGDSGVNEDIEINLLCTLAGFPSLSMAFLFPQPYFAIGDFKHSIASSREKNLDMQANNYIKFGKYLSIRKAHAHYPVKLYFHPDYVNNPFEVDNTFLELCKKRDYEGMIEYSNSHYTKFGKYIDSE